jgi:hypothetical protein
MKLFVAVQVGEKEGWQKEGENVNRARNRRQHQD